MAVLLNEGYESGTNGAQCTQANTGWISGLTVGSAAMLFTNAVVKYGSLSAVYNTTAANIQPSFNFTASPQAYFRRYVQMVSLPAAATYIATSKNSAVKIADLRVNTDGTLTLRDNNTAVYTSTHSLVAGSWARIEWLVAPGTSQQLRMFVGGNVDGLTADDDSGSVACSVAAQTQLDRFSSGVAIASTVNYYEDGVVVDNASWPGPQAAAPQFVWQHNIQVG